MQNTPSLPSLPDPLWLGVVAPEMILSMGQIEVWYLNCMQTSNLCKIELFEMELFDHLTVCKQMTDI